MSRKIYKWESISGKELKDGDILRVKTKNRNHPKFGQYAYAVCTGTGFGCKPWALGNAIFVHHESFHLTVTLKGKDAKTSQEHDVGEARWERFWDFEMMVP